MAGQTLNEKLEGWQVVMVSQVGYVAPEERIECARRLGVELERPCWDFAQNAFSQV